jgi:hypothetical protein
MKPPPTHPLRLALVLAVCLGGCATTSATYTALGAPPRDLHPRKPDEVAVFTTAAPARPHVDVGLIQIQEGLGNETPASLIGALRRIAADKGCDALVLASPSSTTRPTGLELVETSYKVYSGTCIVYRGGQPSDVDARLASPVVLSTTEVDPREPERWFPDQRRMCRDRTDFDRNRNCILPMPGVR